MTNTHRRRPATSLDVAEKAGVSQSTVSLVMSGKAQGRVSQEKQKRVLQAARELDYRPNASARSLRLGRAFSLALVVANVTNPFVSSMLRGVEQAARREHYAIVPLDTGNDPRWIDWVPEVLSAQALDGCIVYTGDRIAENDIARLSSRVVLVETASPNTSSVLFDARSAAMEAIQHLIGLGHTRIGYLAADYPNRLTFGLRFGAYREVLAMHHIPFADYYVAASFFDIDSGVTAAEQLLRHAPPPTAIFCDDDLLAAAVYKAARTVGLRVPTDLSVVGFDELDLARILDPELTTVSIPAERVGEEAILLMQRLITGQEASTKLVPHTLMVRASTAPPAR